MSQPDPESQFPSDALSSKNQLDPILVEVTRLTASTKATLENTQEALQLVLNQMQKAEAGFVQLLEIYNRSKALFPDQSALLQGLAACIKLNAMLEGASHQLTAACEAWETSAELEPDQFHLIEQTYPALFEQLVPVWSQADLFEQVALGIELPSTPLSFGNSEAATSLDVTQRYHKLKQQIEALDLTDPNQLAQGLSNCLNQVCDPAIETNTLFETIAAYMYWEAIMLHSNQPIEQRFQQLENGIQLSRNAQISNPNNPHALIWGAVLSRTIARMSCPCCQRNPHYSDQVCEALERAQALLQSAEPRSPLSDVISELIASAEITDPPDSLRYPPHLA